MSRFSLRGGRARRAQQYAVRDRRGRRHERCGDERDGRSGAMMNPVETWVAAFLTLCVFSFLYRDNPFYRFAEHLFVGASAGYLLAEQYQNVIIPNVWIPITTSKAAPSLVLAIIPAILGVLMVARVSSKMAAPARWAIAFYVGIYSGIAVPGYMNAQVMAQLSDAVKPFAPGWGAVNSALILIGFLTVLA